MASRIPNLGRIVGIRNAIADGDAAVDRDDWKAISDDLPGLRDTLKDMLADSVYVSYDNFEEARASDATVILEGDFGGTIFITCSLRHISCGREEIEQVLRLLDEEVWGGTEGQGASISIEPRALGEYTIGGMGGGWVIEGLWVHPAVAHHRDWIWDVLTGRQSPDTST